MSGALQHACEFGRDGPNSTLLIPPLITAERDGYFGWKNTNVTAMKIGIRTPIEYAM